MSRTGAVQVSDIPAKTFVEAALAHPECRWIQKGKTPGMFQVAYDIEPEAAPVPVVGMELLD